MYQSHVNCSLTPGLSGEGFPSYHGGLEATSNRTGMVKISASGVLLARSQVFLDVVSPWLL
jgi:hypothetical protein